MSAAPPCRSALFLLTAAVPAVLSVGPRAVAAQTTHRLVAGSETVAFGHYDPAKPGAIRVESGDIVEVTTMLTSSPTRLQQMAFRPTRWCRRA